MSTNFLDALREFGITPGEEAEAALDRQLQARPLQITSYICTREETQAIQHIGLRYVRS